MMPEGFEVTDVVFRLQARFPKFAPEAKVIQNFFEESGPRFMMGWSLSEGFEFAKIIAECWEILKAITGGPESKEREPRCKFTHHSFGKPCGARVHVFYTPGRLTAVCERGHEQFVRTISVSNGVI